MKIDKQGGPGESQVPVPPLVFRLDSRSGVPTYLQLVHQVEHALRLGYLRRGDQLPRVKDVVASLAINPNTVLKAYRELEHKGLIGGRPGQGTFVRVAPRTVDVEELAALRGSLVSGWLAEAAAAGLDEEGITALFESALRDFRERPGMRARPRGGRRERPGRREGVA
jgi:GntR family transcriptional regulator